MQGKFHRGVSVRGRSALMQLDVVVIIAAKIHAVPRTTGRSPNRLLNHVDGFTVGKGY